MAFLVSLHLNFTKVVIQEELSLMDLKSLFSYRKPVGHRFPKISDA